MKRMRTLNIEHRTWNVAASLGLALAVLAAGCGKGKATAAPPPKPVPLVQVAQAERRDLLKTMTYTGSVEPVKVARMASPAEGPVVACSIREGDLVTKGQVLVKVGRSRIAETGLDAAREELRRQEAAFARVAQLVTSGSLPGEQVDASRADLKRAEAQVAAMETGAGDYEIGAPWDGVVSRVWIAEGNYVSPRALLVELYDPASLIVRVSVPEQQALAIHADQSVRLSLDAYPGRRFTGTITRVYPELERITRTLTAEVAVKEQVRLLSGMFARVEVTTQTVTNAVVVPETALVVLPDGETVAFVLDGEKAVRRTVLTALEAGGAVAVTSGIQAGERVITRGNDALRDGMPVKVMEAKKREAGTVGTPVSGAPQETAAKDKPAP
jgi:membrane fusion protein, multidrug efflux system